MIQVSLDAEIQAIALNCRKSWGMSEWETLTATRRQVDALIVFFAHGLDNSARENRLAVIAKFLGRPVESFNKVTSGEAKVLIDSMGMETPEGVRLSQHGRELIRWAELAREYEPEPEEHGTFEQQLNASLDIDHQRDGRGEPAGSRGEPAQAVEAGIIPAQVYRPLEWADLPDLRKADDH